MLVRRGGEAVRVGAAVLVASCTTRGHHRRGRAARGGASARPRCRRATAGGRRAPRSRRPGRRGRRCARAVPTTRPVRPASARSMYDGSTPRASVTSWRQSWPRSTMRSSACSASAASRMHDEMQRHAVSRVGCTASSARHAHHRVDVGGRGGVGGGGRRMSDDAGGGASGRRRASRHHHRIAARRSGAALGAAARRADVLRLEHRRGDGGSDGGARGEAAAAGVLCDRPGHASASCRAAPAELGRRPLGGRIAARSSDELRSDASSRCCCETRRSRWSSFACMPPRNRCRPEIRSGADGEVVGKILRDRESTSRL